jgi:periplasmic protein CpxP/Spy
MSKAVAIAASATAAGRVRAVMIGMLMTLLAALSLAAWAQPAPPPAMGERGPGMPSPRGEHGPGMDGMHGWGGMREGMGGMHHGMGGGMMFRGSPERMGRMIDHMLDGLNASDAQRSQIKQIAAGAAADLKAQAGAGRALRQRAMQAFTAPTVDAAAVEQVRQQMLQQHDQMSKRMTQAMLDVARVLTPEQRARLGERMRDRQARMEDRMKRMESMPQAMPPRR